MTAKPVLGASVRELIAIGASIGGGIASPAYATTVQKQSRLVAA